MQCLQKSSFFYYQNLQFMEKTIKKDAVSGDTCTLFYYSHMILPVFSRAQR